MSIISSDTAWATLSNTGKDFTSTDANTLSSDDVFEIKKFAENKSRITDLTEVLLTRADLDPFEDFEKVPDLGDESKSFFVENISEAWRNLETKLQQVIEWQDERDEIETEAAQFEVGDVERLRKVAKAASEREMSTQDTDLIEITIQTLVALDALLRLLKSRREALDLLQGRLRWEERRKDCWTSYTSLSHDLNEFVSQARWSPDIYQRNTGQNESLQVHVEESKLYGTFAPDWSPNTARSASGSSYNPSTSNAKRIAVKIKTHSTALKARCHAFVVEVVPLASNQLDELIEQRKLPDVILDEQDRLEDLAESIKERELFTLQLALQWRQADETFRQLRSLHISGKQLSSTLASAQRELPLKEHLSDFRHRSDYLRRKLEALCGTQNAAIFLSSKQASSDLLSTQMLQGITYPTSKEWPEQEQHSNQIKDVLAKELFAAAKYIQQACHSTDKYKRSLQSHGKMNNLIFELEEISNVYKYVTRRIRYGWTEEIEEPKSSVLKIPSHLLHTSFNDGNVPDLDDIDCLAPGSYSHYLEQLPKMDPFLAKAVLESGQLIDAIEEVTRECIQNGVIRTLFQKEADDAIYHVKTAKEDAAMAMKNAQLNVELLWKMRKIDVRIEGVASESKACLEDATRLLILGLQSSTQGQAFPSLDALRTKYEFLSRERANTRSILDNLSTKMKTLKVENVVKKLEERDGANLHLVTSLQDIGQWLSALNEQHGQLAALEAEYKRLSDVSYETLSLLKIEQTVIPKDVQIMMAMVKDGQARLEVQLIEKDGICLQIQQYIIATHSKITLCGQPPLDLIKCYSQRGGEEAQIQAIDDAVREKFNNWCSRLSSLHEDIDVAWKEACQRQEKRKQDLEQQQQLYQDGITAALAAFEAEMKYAEEQCNALEASLNTIEEEMSSIAMVGIHELDQVVNSFDFKQRKVKDAAQKVLDIQERDQCSDALSSQIETSKDDLEHLCERSETLKQRLEHIKSAAEKQQAAVVEATLDGSDKDSTHHSIEEGLSKTENLLVDGQSSFAIISKRDKGDSGKKDGVTQRELQEGMEPHSVPSLTKLSSSDEEAEDVFGPTLHKVEEMATSKEQEKDHHMVAQLKDKLCTLLSQCSGGIVDEQTRSSGKTQLQNGIMLPTVEEAEAIRQSWKDLKASVKDVLIQIPLLFTSEGEQVRTILQVRDAKIRRFGLLATFGHQHGATEEALSRFLDLLDQSGDEQAKEVTQQHLFKLKTLIDQAILLAEPVLTDVRIRHQLSQLRHSYQDMMAMAKENDCKENTTQSNCHSRSSSVSSMLSLSGSASDKESNTESGRRTPSFPPTRPSQNPTLGQFAIPSLINTPHRARTKSSSSGSYMTAPQSTPRQSSDRRSVSDGSSMYTPSRLPLAMSRSNVEMPTPKGLSQSQSTTTLIGSTPHTPQATLNDTVRKRSDSGAKLWTKLPMRSPSGTNNRVVSHRPSASFASSSSSTSSLKPNQYLANPKSKLDVAVAKIVNKLPMQVNITHAASAATMGTKAKEQYHDESGRYWVGHPEPKLCFCRILRSRTVMVRIGGGWQELSTYILKHYSHLAPDTSLSIAPSPQSSPQMEREKLDKLSWTTTSSALLNTPTGKSTLKSFIDYSPENGYLTPVNERNERKSPASVRTVRKVTTTPQFVSSIPSATSSPSKLSNLGGQMDKSGQIPEMNHGLWIRRDRKTSQRSASNGLGSTLNNHGMRATSLNYQQRPPEQGMDPTRSTTSSRNRKISNNSTIPILARRRVESLSGSSSESNSVLPSGRVRSDSLIGTNGNNLKHHIRPRLSSRTSSNGCDRVSPSQ